MYHIPRNSIMDKTIGFTVDKYDALPAKDLKISYFHALPVSCQPLCGLTIGQVLDIASREKPDHVVFQIPEFNQSLTFSELSAKANALARGFLALGLRKGDTVLSYHLVDENFFTVYIACALLGLPLIYPYLFAPEDIYLKRLILKAQPSLIIADPERGSNVGRVLEQLMNSDQPTGPESFQRPTTLNGVVTIKKGTFHGIPTIDEVIEKGRSVDDNTLTSSKQRVSTDDCAYILATSGSSGEPKLVCLSHYAFVNFGLFCTARRAQGKRELFGMQSPFRDDVMAAFGTIELICQWKVGSVGIVLPLTVDFTDKCAIPLLKAIEQHRITRPGIYPFQILNMIKCPEFANYDISSVTGVTLVAQAITPETRQKLLELFPDTMIAYGMSEHLGIACTHPGIKYNDPHTVGYPLPHHEVKIVGESREILPVDNLGEIWVRGPCRFLRYLHDDEKTRDILDTNGWVHTGDIGKMNSDGYLTLYGRKEDRIRYKVRCDVVYPGQIEQATMTFHKVKEAKAVGVPVDEREGDSICLCVIPQPGVSLSEEELRSHCGETLIARDRPDYYFIMESFPRVGARQKVSRPKLKEIIQERLMGSNPNQD